MQNKKTAEKGFTLIELLVVVLIIGILSYIGIIQYQKAVIKSRVSLVLSTMKQWKRTYDWHVLANGCCSDTRELTWDTFTSSVKGYNGVDVNPAQTTLGAWVEIDIGGWTYVSQGMGGAGIDLCHSNDNHCNAYADAPPVFTISFLPPGRCNNSGCGSWVTGPGEIIIYPANKKATEKLVPVLIDLGAKKQDHLYFF
jgi:prepilin-type N-terminal cleavage/methylation domain-containing protein